MLFLSNFVIYLFHLIWMFVDEKYSGWRHIVFKSCGGLEAET